MRTRASSSAAGLLVGLLLIAGAAWARPEEAPALPHRIAIDARGPLALVEVTRALAVEKNGCDATLEIALPDGAALVAVEVRDGGRWRALDAASPDAKAAERFGEERKRRGPGCAEDAEVGLPDSDTSVRLRLAVGAGGRSPVNARYRFAVATPFVGGRFHLRFPPSPERIPTPADVVVQTRDAVDLEIAGARAPRTSGPASGHASTRSGWEVSWAPREPATGDAPSLDARLAAAPLSAGETAIAYALRARAARPAAPPASVLFVIDRSRSVGLPGLAAERDLARRLLEALPPATRFDALFFDRASKRLFPLARPATREALDALEAEMVPDRLQNGTDLAAALHDAGALLRHEPPGGGRILLAVLTDGALPAQHDGAALDKALGALPGLDLTLAAFVVRAADDEPMPAHARQSLHDLAALRGGLARELRPADVGDGAPAALADLDRGGDVGNVRLEADGRPRRLAEAVAPGSATAGVVVVPGHPPRRLALTALVRGHQLSIAAAPTAVAPEWLRPPAPPAAGPPQARLMLGKEVIVLLEPIAHPAPAGEAPVRGSMDRMVMRNVLSLAYMPRARACYLGRSGASLASRDLTGRVRLAIDVVRGEVERAIIESSTLKASAIEDCLRDGAFAIEVPRAVRSDAPVTAVLNLNFRPHTPEKPAPDLGAVGDQIDLVIESAHAEQAHLDGAHPDASPAAGAAEARSPTTFPTR
jgi:Mg-chelatase subunit ChlD